MRPHQAKPHHHHLLKNEKNKNFVKMINHHADPENIIKHSILQASKKAIKLLMIFRGDTIILNLNSYHFLSRSASHLSAIHKPSIKATLLQS